MHDQSTPPKPPADQIDTIIKLSERVQTLLTDPEFANVSPATTAYVLASQSATLVGAAAIAGGLTAEQATAIFGGMANDVIATVFGDAYATMQKEFGDTTIQPDPQVAANE